jgi:predicted MPP superfamily phosphohydrolase
MVSSGVGLIGLPARLGVAPRIDVLHLDAAP